MSATEILGLMIAAAAGGAINAVAGGGTLVTFPALLLFGTPPIIANATSTWHWSSAPRGAFTATGGILSPSGPGSGVLRPSAPLGG